MVKNKLLSGVMALFVGIMVIFALVGCDLDGDPTDGAANAGVYVAGVYNTYRAGGNFYNSNRACYWKNGKRIELSNVDSTTTAIAVVGSDVYVVGDYYDAGSLNRIPCYWKNGKRIDLEGSSAVAIAVSGSDVYIAGWYDVFDDGIPLGGWVACYWKNGKRTDFWTNGPKTGSQAYAIAVVGSDVYVAGQSNAYSDFYASYWKNGTRTRLHFPDSGRSSPIDSRANAIAVAGSDVFVTGRYEAGGYNDTGTYIYKFRACYWKNGEKIDLLPLGDYDHFYGEAGAITVAGSDVYILGVGEYNNYDDPDSYNYIACYWKNGERIDLPFSGSDYGYSAITVAGSDVYLAGSFRDGNDPIACYWKNGEMTKLAAEYSTATAIVVVE